MFRRVTIGLSRLDTLLRQGFVGPRSVSPICPLFCPGFRRSRCRHAFVEAAGEEWGCHERRQGADGEGKVSNTGHNYRSDAENSVVDDGHAERARNAVQIFKGDYNSMSRFGSTMMSVNTILSFFIQPYSGAFMDHYGRWPMLVLPPLLVGIARIWMGLKPSKTTYTLYRICAGLVAIPWFPAYRATFSDLFDRGSDQYVQTMNNIENVSSVLRLVSLYIVGNYLSAEQGYIGSGIVSILSSLAFYFFVEETLEEQKSKSDRMEEIAQPLIVAHIFHAIQRFKEHGILVRVEGDTRV